MSLRPNPQVVYRYARWQHANALLCWNWSEHERQQRGSGEPALVASMTQAVIKLHRVDARRVCIAGLSVQLGRAGTAPGAPTAPQMPCPPSCSTVSLYVTAQTEHARLGYKV